MVRLLKGGKEDDELYLWFDGKEGFNIVHEKRIQNKMILNDIQRTFQNIDGIWMLKSFSWTRYAAESGVDGKQHIDGKQYCEVVELNLNKQIPDETFDLRGFGLKPRTHVWDKISGVDYTLDPLAAVQDQVKEIMQSVETSIYSEGSTQPKAARTVAHVSEDGSNSLSSKENDHSPHRQGKKLTDTIEAQATDKHLYSTKTLRDKAYIVVFFLISLAVMSYFWWRWKGSRNIIRGGK